METASSLTMGMAFATAANYFQGETDAHIKDQNTGPAWIGGGLGNQESTAPKGKNCRNPSKSTQLGFTD
ncbi:MAG: hypothetical protein EOP36_01205 [Rubrivivax sp.]|nr:MAG: hypothetical protein EOP36_01205 [Rubrivivax sp.]